MQIKYSLPIVIISVSTFSAQALMNIKNAAIIEPAMVTARHPYLLTRADEIGPEAQRGDLFIHLIEYGGFC